MSILRSRLQAPDDGNAATDVRSTDATTRGCERRYEDPTLPLVVLHPDRRFHHRCDILHETGDQGSRQDVHHPWDTEHSARRGLLVRCCSVDLVNTVVLLLGHTRSAKKPFPRGNPPRNPLFYFSF